MSYWVYGLFDCGSPENQPDDIWTIDLHTNGDGYNGTMDRCTYPQPMSGGIPYALFTQPTVIDLHHKLLGDVFKAGYAVDADAIGEETANQLAHDYFTRLVRESVEPISRRKAIDHQ